MFYKKLQKYREYYVSNQAHVWLHYRKKKYELMCVLQGLCFFFFRMEKVKTEIWPEILRRYLPRFGWREYILSTKVSEFITPKNKNALHTYKTTARRYYYQQSCNQSKTSLSTHHCFNRSRLPLEGNLTNWWFLYSINYYCYCPLANFSMFNASCCLLHCFATWLLVFNFFFRFLLRTWAINPFCRLHTTAEVLR